MEQLMLIRGVVRHDVNDDSKPQGFHLGKQGIEFFVGSKYRINRLVVGYVVAGVLLG